MLSNVEQPPAPSDHELLRQFTRGADRAFSDLVHRHIDAVYSAALRQVQDPHTAADVTNAVFTILAQKAAALSEHVFVLAWLHRATRYAALKAIRANQRRQRYENAYMQELHETSDAWQQMAPHLDEGLLKLADKDHEAILLRFFQRKGFAEIGAHLHTTEEGARKRVDRALEKLRRFLDGRGAAFSLALLSSALVSHAVQATPPGLTDSIAGLTPTTPPSSLALETLKSLRWFRLKPLLVPAASLLFLLIFWIVQPSPPRSPLDSFRRLTKATREGDLKTWRSLLQVGNPAESQARESLGTNVLVKADLRRALIRMFGENSYRQSDFPRMLDDISDQDLALAEQTISGTNGAVRLPTGSNLKFVRMNGAWKFDFFRTSRAPPEQIRSSSDREIIAAKAVRDLLERGDYNSVTAAAADFKRRR